MRFLFLYMFHILLKDKTMSFLKSPDSSQLLLWIRFYSVFPKSAVFAKKSSGVGGKHLKKQRCQRVKGHHSHTTNKNNIF